MIRPALLVAVVCLSACSSRPAVEDGLSESAYISGDGLYAQPKARGLSAQEAATDKNVIGCVKVEYLINLDGSARDVKIVRSEPAGYFDARVLVAMEQIRFRPREALGYGERTFSFGPNQSRDVLKSAAALCDTVAVPKALPPPPESGHLEEESDGPSVITPNPNPRRPGGKR